MERSTYEPVQSGTTISRLQDALNGLMEVEEITILDNKARPAVRFGGHLISGEEDGVFQTIVDRFAKLSYTPVLSEEQNLQILRAVPVVADHKTGKAWVNAVLFVLTVLSVLFLGALREDVDVLANPLGIWRGWRFAVTMLGILTAHELSHYFVGLRYGSPTSLPYFIPLPLSILGTMGAVIVQRGPMRSRKALFDIGIAGPLGGLIVAIPLLFIGLATSYVGTPRDFMNLPPGEPIPVMQEGNSLLYAGAKYLIHGQVLPNPETGEDVWLSPPSPGGSVAFAAWAGLLVTALNLFPIGQFDGGHIAYALWGRRAWGVARIFVYLILGWGLLLMVLGNQAGITWLVWGGLGMLVGHRHPPPLNDVTPLDRRRKILGWAMVAIFVLILIPIPLIETVIR
ncbi:MAG: site-2 protease family protein [Anaerolineae bacterium]|nr:site-2 protease family protein [Anaerolineae bacterium]